MRSRRRASIAVCVSLSCASADLVVAQEAPPQGTSLPPVVVETQKSAPKAKAKAKKKAPAAAMAAPAVQPEPVPQQPAGLPRTSNGTAYGPVEGYVAESTATGIKTNTPLNEIPQSISVVGTEQMRDQGAQTLSDALRYVPGVVAESFGLDSRTDGQFIRGVKPAQFLDGMRSNYNEFFYGYRIESYFMERIEVLRGPSSVLYGQAPVGGIVNAVSKRPHGAEGGEITVEYGTFDFKQVKFDHSGLVTSDGKWSYRVTGSAREADTQVDYVDDDRLAIQPAITWRPDTDTTITLLGYFQKDRTGSTAQFLPHAGTLYPNADGRRIPRSRFIGEPGDHYDTDVASGTLFVEHKFNSALKINHVSRYADVNNEYETVTPASWDYVNLAIAPPDSLIYRYKSDSSTHSRVFNQDTNIEARFSTGAVAHRVLGGFDYAHFDAERYEIDAFGIVTGPYSIYFNVYDPRYGETTFVPFFTPCPTGCATDQTLTQTGIYIQDQMRLGNWIGVVGARKDWVDNDISGRDKQKDDEVTYRAGLMYEFGFGLTPYVSYAESFVPVPGFSSPADGGDPFDPQTGRMYEVGFKYQPKGANFAINASVFDMDETGRLVYGTGSWPKQLGEVALKGFEIELTGKVTENLSIIGGYSYTEAEYGQGTTDTRRRGLTILQVNDVSGNQLESIPKHLASLWALWEFDQPELKGWSVGGGVRYIGKSWDSSNTLEVPSVTLFDAMVAYETEDWRWQLTGRNLEDKEYVSTCLYRGDCWLGTARTIQTGFTYKY